MFKAAMLPRIAESDMCDAEGKPMTPTSLVRYWDSAASAGAGDYTVGVLMGMLNGRYVILDVQRGQWETFERERIKAATAERDRARWGGVTIWLEQEPGSSGLDSVRATIRALAGHVVYAEPATGKKTTRAEPLAAQAGAGNVALLKAAWNAAFIDELCAFPYGAHDDQVDAASGAFNKLARPRGVEYGPDLWH